VPTSRSELLGRDAEADAPNPISGVLDASREGQSAGERLRGRVVRDLAATRVREEGPPEAFPHLLVQLLDRLGLLILHADIVHSSHKEPRRHRFLYMRSGTDQRLCCAHELVPEAAAVDPNRSEEPIVGARSQNEERERVWHVMGRCCSTTSAGRYWRLALARVRSYERLGSHVRI